MGAWAAQTRLVAARLRTCHRSGWFPGWSFRNGDSARFSLHHSLRHIGKRMNRASAGGTCKMTAGDRVARALLPAALDFGFDSARAANEACSVRRSRKRSALHLQNQRQNQKPRARVPAPHLLGNHTEVAKVMEGNRRSNDDGPLKCYFSAWGCVVVLVQLDNGGPSPRLCRPTSQLQRFGTGW